MIKYFQLVETMIHSGGKREGKILSLYLINIVNDFIVEGFYKRDSSCIAMRYKIKEKIVNARRRKMLQILVSIHLR